MMYSEREVRELVALTITLTQGGYPREAHERFVALTGGLSIGDVRYLSQHDDIVFFSYDAASGEIRDRRIMTGIDFFDHKAAFAGFAAKQDEALGVEAFGRYWAWSKTPGTVCLGSERRPKGYDVMAVAERLFTEIDEQNSSFELNEFQKAAVRTYADGDYAAIADMKGRREIMEAVNQTYSAMLLFLVVELGSPGLSADEAAERLEGLGEDIADVLAAVRNAPAPRL